MRHYERTYRTARTVYAVLEFVSWALVLIGLAIAVGGGFLVGMSMPDLGGMKGLLAIFAGASSGLYLSIVGLFGVAYVQTSKATVDSAEMLRDLLKLGRENLNGAPPGRGGRAGGDGKPLVLPAEQRLD